MADAIRCLGHAYSRGLLWGVSYALLGDAVPAIGNFLSIAPSLAYSLRWPARHKINAVCCAAILSWLESKSDGEGRTRCQPHGANLMV